MMRAPDNSLAQSARVFSAVLVLALGASCNRMVTPPAKQTLKDAEAKSAAGDYLEAITLYERALNGSEDSAEIHYRIALLYDDRMKDPLNALHHFKRYLTIAPSGPRANAVKEFMKRDELALVTALSGDTVLSRAEATRLKNENLTLRQQLAERGAQLKATAASEKSAARQARAEKASAASKKTKSTRRKRVVNNQ